MANTKTAKKQLQISERNRVRNLHYKTIMKNAVKKAKAAIAAGEDQEAARAAVSNVVRTLHRTATRGIIKRRNASRRVSRMMIAFNKAFNPAPAVEETAVDA